MNIKLILLFTTKKNDISLQVNGNIDLIKFSKLNLIYDNNLKNNLKEYCYFVQQEINNRKILSSVIKSDYFYSMCKELLSKKYDICFGTITRMLEDKHPVEKLHINATKIISNIIYNKCNICKRYITPNKESKCYFCNDKKLSVFSTKTKTYDAYCLHKNIISLLKIYIGKKYCNDDNIYHLLGYRISNLYEHLENMFEPWMNWNNWGRYKIGQWDHNNISTWEWQIDHIRAVYDFDLEKDFEKTIKECWSLCNLRPYSAYKNLLEGVRKDYLRK